MKKIQVVKLPNIDPIIEDTPEVTPVNVVHINLVSSPGLIDSIINAFLSGTITDETCKKLLTEVLIRFDTDPKRYTKQDFGKLIETIIKIKEYLKTRVDDLESDTGIKIQAIWTWLNNYLQEADLKFLTLNTNLSNLTSKVDSLPSKFKTINDIPVIGEGNIEIKLLDSPELKLIVKDTVREIGVPSKVSLLYNDVPYLKPSDITGKADKGVSYTKEESDNKYLTEHLSLAGYATESWVEGKGYLTLHQDISGKANVGDSYTKIESDAKYITLHQSLDGYATLNWVESKGYLTLHQSLEDYTKTEDLSDVALSGSYNDLLNKPTIPTDYVTTSEFENMKLLIYAGL